MVPADAWLREPRSLPLAVMNSRNFMDQFREFIKEDRVRVFDGAMGTMIYSKGVYINRSYDELSLSGAEIVLAIHREYVKAGAEIIETNTYGASRLKLAAQGLDDKLAEINATAAKIARKACPRSASRRLRGWRSLAARRSHRAIRPDLG